MRIKVFTHTDLDGIGPVVLLKTLLEAEVDYETHGYGTIDGAVNAYVKDRLYVDYDMTFITDISIRENFAIEAIKCMVNRGHKVVLLDHHLTAEPLNKYSWAKVVTEKPNCGTTLTLDYIKKEMSELYDYVNINTLAFCNHFARLVSYWDTWLWAESDDNTPKLLNDLFYIYGKDTFLENMVNKMQNALDLFSDEDLLVLDIRQKQINRYIETKAKQLMIVEHAYEELTAGMVFAEEYFSELGHELLNEFDEIDYIMMIDIGAQKVSLRAREEDDIDVEVIAKFHGGGGHKKAAGFRFEHDIYDTWIRNVL